MASVQNAVSIISPLTQNFEGYASSPYFDVNGYAIGFGNHFYSDGSSVDQTDPPISESDAIDLLNYWLTDTANRVANLLTVPVSDNMLAALTDLAYNWGIGNFEKSVLLQLINSGASSSDIVAQWNRTAVTAAGVPDLDLAKRRAQEADLATSVLPGALAVATSFIGSDQTIFLILGGIVLLIALPSLVKALKRRY